MGAKLLFKLQELHLGSHSELHLCGLTALILTKNRALARALVYLATDQPHQAWVELLQSGLELECLSQIAQQLAMPTPSLSVNSKSSNLPPRQIVANSLDNIAKQANSLFLPKVYHESWQQELVSCIGWCQLVLKRLPALLSVMTRNNLVDEYTNHCYTAEALIKNQLQPKQAQLMMEVLRFLMEHFKKALQTDA